MMHYILMSLTFLILLIIEIPIAYDMSYALFGNGYPGVLTSIIIIVGLSILFNMLSCKS